MGSEEGRGCGGETEAGSALLSRPVTGMESDNLWKIFWENMRATYVSFSCFVPRITSLNVIIDTFFRLPPVAFPKKERGEMEKGKK